MLEALARLPTEVALVVLALLVALGVIGWTLATLVYGPRARLKRRLAVIAGVQPANRGKGVVALGMMRRKTIQGRLRRAEDVRTKRRGYRLREELNQAGLHIEVRHFVVASAGLAVASYLVASAMALSPPAALLVAVIVGVGLPKLVLAIRARRRLGRFTSQLADGLDIITRGIRSGLPLVECISIIGREMPEPIGAEFRLISEAQKLGLSLQDALERAVERMPTPELRFLSIVIAIQQQTGGNLAETLAKLSEVLRSRKRMRDKVQAYASEARASAMIIGSLPILMTLVLSVIAPDYVGVLFTTETGHVLLFIGCSVMGIGTLVMRQMINFDI